MEGDSMRVVHEEILHICDQCGEKFSTLNELISHDAGHILLTVEEGLTYLLTLSDGCTEGRWEAAKEFTEAYKLLRERLPGRTFTITPFESKYTEENDYGGSTAVTTYLVFVNPL